MSSSYKKKSSVLNLLSLLYYRSREVGQPQSLAVVDQVADTVSQLSLDGDANSESKPAVEHQPALGIPDCKCGMPLCICVTPVQSEAVPLQVLIFSNF